MRALVSAIVAILVGCGGHGPAAQTPTPARSASGETRAAKPHAQGHPSTTLPDRLTFFTNATYTQVRLSPDGKRLLWLGPRNNVMLLWVGAVDDTKHGAMVTTDTTRPVTAAIWTTDAKHVLYVQDPNGDGNVHLFRYDVDDSKVTDLIPIKGARVDLLGVGPRHANSVMVGINDRDASIDDIYEVDIRTGDRKRVVQNDEKLTTIIIDWDMKVRLGGKQLPDGSVQIMALGAKGWSLWDTISADERDGVRILGIDFAGTHAFMIDTRNRDTAALVSVDIKTKKQKVLAEDPHLDIAQAFANPSDGEIGAVAFTDVKTTWHAIDPSVTADVAGLDKVADGAWEITSATRDGQTWLVAYGSDVQSGKYYLWNRKTKTATYVFSMTPELDTLPLAHSHAWKIKARDGLTLTAFTTVPHDHDATNTGIPDHPLPTVMVIQAENQTRVSVAYDQLPQWLANRGYVVLAVNARGTDGYGKKFSHAGDREWGGAIEQDLFDTVAWAIAQKIADPTKIAILGANYGGFAAVTALEQAPDTFACAIDILGPMNLNTFARVTAPQYASLFMRKIGDPTTPEGSAKLDAISATSHPEAIKRPLLVFHSSEKAAGSDTAKIVDNLHKRGVPVSFLEFPDEAVTITRPENNVAMLGAIEAYLSEQLGGAFEPMTAEMLAASSIKAIVGGEGVPGLPDQ